MRKPQQLLQTVVTTGDSYVSISSNYSCRHTRGANAHSKVGCGSTQEHSPQSHDAARTAISEIPVVGDAFSAQPMTKYDAVMSMLLPASAVVNDMQQLCGVGLTQAIAIVLVADAWPTCGAHTQEAFISLKLRDD